MSHVVEHSAHGEFQSDGSIDVQQIGVSAISQAKNENLICDCCASSDFHVVLDDTSNEKIILYDHETEVVLINNRVALRYKDLNTERVQTLYVKDIIKKDKNHTQNMKTIFLLGIFFFMHFCVYSYFIISFIF